LERVERGLAEVEVAMAEITTGVAVRQLQAVLREAFEGPKERWSYFTDNNPDAGFFGTLRRLDAAGASRMIGGGSIAAYVYHMAFALEASTVWIAGDRSPRKWSESWAVTTVDGPAWARLLERLRAGYDGLRGAMEAHALDNEEAIGGAIAAVAHAAYHLGCIQQKLAFAGLRGG
jgi:hypothetical protein